LSNTKTRTTRNTRPLTLLQRLGVVAVSLTLLGTWTPEPAFYGVAFLAVVALAVWLTLLVIVARNLSALPRVVALAPMVLGLQCVLVGINALHYWTTRSPVYGMSAAMGLLFGPYIFTHAVFPLLRRALRVR
jgi:NAD/NADP transhydrogenase beta subunit